MSNSAKSITRIEFKVPVPEEFKTAAALETALIKFYEDSTGDYVTPHFQINDFEVYDSEVTFELSSTRRVNLEFQANLLREYLEVTYENKVEELNEDLWVQA